ncbi:MAG: hypothetical protein IKC22_07045 [Bacilli bacterium]|nr:hypothetical protein [Bacilli bacterium]
MIKTSDFPYPVLRSDKSVLTSYKREYYLNINCDDPINNENEYIFKTQLLTNSETINNMLSEGKASSYIIYQTKILKRIYKIDNSDLTYELKIPYSYFQSMDEVKISAIITANEDFELLYNDEIDDGYNLDVPYFITKKDIVAISNEIIFDFNKTGKTIIKLIKRNDLTSGFQVNINQDEYILIEVNPEFKKAYDVVAVKQSELKIPALTMIHSSLIHMAMINVFIRLIKEDYKQHINKRWFKVIRSTLNTKDVILEDSLSDLNEDFDINKVYELVDKFLNHFFDKAISKCSEALK